MIDRRGFLQALGLGVLASSGLGGRWFRQGSGTRIILPRPVAWVAASVKLGDGPWEWRERALTQIELDGLQQDGAYNCFNVIEALVPHEERLRLGLKAHSYDDLVIAQGDPQDAWGFAEFGITGKRSQVDRPIVKMGPGALVPIIPGEPTRVESFEVRMLTPDPEPWQDRCYGFRTYERRGSGNWLTVDDGPIDPTSTFDTGSVCGRLPRASRVFDPWRLP